MDTGTLRGGEYPEVGGAIAIALAFIVGASQRSGRRRRMQRSHRVLLTRGSRKSTVASTICTRGYTATVRNVSTQTKHAVYVEYGISRAAQRGYVIDHLVPLEVGGANDIKNLWPEPKADAKVKDVLEGQMHAAVCNGSLSLTDAQARFLIASRTDSGNTRGHCTTRDRTASDRSHRRPHLRHRRSFTQEPSARRAGDTGVTTAGRRWCADLPPMAGTAGTQPEPRPSFVGTWWHVGRSVLAGVRRPSRIARPCDTGVAVA